MLIHKTGDIFTTGTGVIGHGVNCRGVMGSGIAVTVREMYPEVFASYRDQCLNISDSEKLTGGGLFPYRAGDGTWILNLASQQEEGRSARYDFLRESVHRAFDWCRNNGFPVFALPRIGSGVGGLDEAAVQSILEIAAYDNPDVDLELWTYDR